MSAYRIQSFDYTDLNFDDQLISIFHSLVIKSFGFMLLLSVMFRFNSSIINSRFCIKKCKKFIHVCMNFASCLNDLFSA